MFEDQYPEDHDGFGHARGVSSIERMLWSRLIGLLTIVMLAIWLAPNAHAQHFAGIAIGRSQTPNFFDAGARYAFPDLATGGGDCCTLTHATDGSARALRLWMGTRFDNHWGLEASVANLGRFDSSFDTSGAFLTALQRPGVQSGRCVESGRFRFSDVTFAGSYEFRAAWGLSVVPKLGVSGVMVAITTQSHCDFLYTDGSTASIDKPQDLQRFAFVPVAGLGLRWKIREGLSLSIDVEQRDHILVADSAEARERDRGRVRLTTAWAGIERRW